MAVSEEGKSYEHPLYRALQAPGLSVAVGSLDQLLTWGLTHSLWVFPMATSCCGIELMAAAASRVDLDRMGTIIRGSPRQADVMVVAGTITVKMAPRVRRLWDQMPEPKWCIAMGSCAISGDFYRNVYPVVPGIDTVVPVDVYVPGCPPNPEALMQGLLQLQEKVRLQREGKLPPRAPDKRPRPGPRSVLDPERDPGVTEAQTAAARAPGDGAGRFLEELLAVPPTVEFVPQAAVGAGCRSGLHSPLTPAPSQGERGVEFAAVMRSRFGLEVLPTDAPPLVEASRHLELARALREAGYTLFGFVVASHWPAAADGTGEQHEVAYGLRRPGPGAPLASWRVRVPVGEEVDSLCGLFAGADWQEREQFDLVGVRFRGHPDLRRLMLPDAWQGHPLRRDQPIDTPCPPWR